MGTHGGSELAGLALELVDVTEAAAVAAGRWAGSGDKEGADGAAVEAMRTRLHSVPMDGVVVIGEGEKDEAPMLFNGESVGNGAGIATDIAVDPIDGTTLLSKGRPNAIAVMAIAGRGKMFNPGPCVYMEKIATGPAAADAIDIERPVADNLKAVADATGKDVNEVVAVVLERDRHAAIIDDCRQSGARVRLIPDGDVAGAISTVIDDLPGDILIGIGGTPEGVIAAAALKALGGRIQGRLWPRNDAERQAAIDAGHDLTRVIDTEDLVAGDAIFAASGITDGDLVSGVRYGDAVLTTETLLLGCDAGVARRIWTSRPRPA